MSDDMKSNNDPGRGTAADMLEALEADAWSLTRFYPEGINKAAIMDYLGVRHGAARAIMRIAHRSKVFKIVDPHRPNVGGKALWPKTGKKGYPDIPLFCLELREVVWIQRLRDVAHGGLEPGTPGSPTESNVWLQAELIDNDTPTAFVSPCGERSINLDMRGRAMVKKLANLGCFSRDYSLGRWSFRRGLDNINSNTRVDFEARSLEKPVVPVRSRFRPGVDADKSISLVHLVRCIAADVKALTERFGEGITAAALNYHYGCSLETGRKALAVLVADRHWLLCGQAGYSARYWPPDYGRPLPIIKPTAISLLAYIEGYLLREDPDFKIGSRQAAMLLRVPDAADALGLGEESVARFLRHLERRSVVKRMWIRDRSIWHVTLLRRLSSINADRLAWMGLRDDGSFVTLKLEEFE